MRPYYWYSRPESAHSLPASVFYFSPSYLLYSTFLLETGFCATSSGVLQLSDIPCITQPGRARCPVTSHVSCDGRIVCFYLLAAPGSWRHACTYYSYFCDAAQSPINIWFIYQSRYFLCTIKTHIHTWWAWSFSCTIQFTMVQVQLRVRGWGGACWCTERSVTGRVSKRWVVTTIAPWPCLLLAAACYYCHLGWHK